MRRIFYFQPGRFGPKGLRYDLENPQIESRLWDLKAVVVNAVVI